MEYVILLSGQRYKTIYFVIIIIYIRNNMKLVMLSKS